MTITREMTMEETHDKLRETAKFWDSQEHVTHWKCAGSSQGNFGKGRPGCGRTGIEYYMQTHRKDDPEGVCPSCNGSIQVVRTETVVARQNFSFADMCNMPELNGQLRWSY